MDWIIPYLDNIITISIFTVIVALRDNALSKQKDEELAIKHDYRRKSYSFAEDVLEGVVSIISGRMRECTKHLEISCPESVDSCGYPSRELAQQLLLYYLIVESVFMIDIKAKVVNSIRENGFLKMNHSELENHIRMRGKRFFEIAKAGVATKSGETIPNLMKYVGSTYTEEEAIDNYREVVEKAIANTILTNKEIEELRRKNSYIKNIFTRDRS